MPRFDFECRKCRKTFEHLLPSGASPPACRHCGSADVTKLLSPPPVIFKGKGFYKTDSRRGVEREPCPTGKASDFARASPDKSEDKKERKDTEIQSPEKRDKAPKPPKTP